MNAKHILLVLAATVSPLAAQYSLEAPLRCTGEKLLEVFEPQRAVLQISSALILDGRDESAYGVVVSADGYILTKASEFTKLKQPVVVIDKKRYPSVQLVGQDPKWDVCLIKVEAEGLKPVEFAETSDVPLGSWVCANGVSSRFSRRLLMGVVSARPHRILPAGGLAMGIALKEEDKGLKVEGVEPKGGAQAAGVLKGDVLISADGKPVKKVEELVELLKTHYTGDKVLLVLKRDKVDVQLFVTVMPRFQMVPPPNRNDMMSGDFSERRSDFPRVVQHSILGSSKIVGGPLIALDGKCIGMNIARANRAESFAIPVEEMKEIYTRLLAGQIQSVEPKEAAATTPAE